MVGRKTSRWHVYGYFEGRDTAVDLGEHPNYATANLAAGSWLKSMARAERCELLPVYEEDEA